METNDWTNNVSIILVRPEFLGNIGSTCRVLKNFGFADLRLVDAPKNYKDAEARMMAVGAFNILKDAKLFDTLKDATEDISYTVATSSGRKRSRPLANLSDAVDDLIDIAKINRIAIVFGHERNGLLDEELALCNIKVRIESSLEFPSMNVSQAVCATAYALNVAGKRNLIQPSEVPKIPELPSNRDARELFDQLDLLVDNIDFSRSFNKEKILTEIREAIQRMAPTKRECSLIKGVLFTLNRKLEVTNNRDDVEV